MSEGTKKAESKGVSIFDISDVVVVLTYLATNPATIIRLPLRLLLNTEETSMRQKFFSLPDDQQDAGRHKYNCELLASLLTGSPEGLPGWTDPAADSTQDRKAAFVEYFAGPDANGMKKKIVSDAVQQYNQITQPREFFR